MPKRITPLSEVKVRNAKPQANEYKLFDGGGLFLLITPSGGKLWRFRYPFDKKEQKLSLGIYPEISLLDARKRRDEARSQLAHGIDPGAVRKAQKQANTEATETFEAIAREWFQTFLNTWKESHAKRIIGRLERNVFPFLGQTPISEIKAPELLATIRRVEARGTFELAHRMRTICSQVFRYAVATGRAERDPAADLRGALKPVQTINMAAITDPKKVGDLLRAIDVYQGSFVVQCALKLAPLVFVRPGELRQELRLVVVDTNL